MEPPYGVAPSVKSAASRRCIKKLELGQNLSFSSFESKTWSIHLTTVQKLAIDFPNFTHFYLPTVVTCTHRSEMKSPVSSMASEDEASSSKGKNGNPFETIDDE